MESGNRISKLRLRRHHVRGQISRDRSTKEGPGVLCSERIGHPLATFKKGCDVSFAFRANTDDCHCRTISHYIHMVAPYRKTSQFLNLGCSVYSVPPPDETFRWIRITPSLQIGCESRALGLCDLFRSVNGLHLACPTLCPWPLTPDCS